MQDLKFNRVHKNGWLSWRLPGVKGAVFIDKRMLTPEALANPPATLSEALEMLVPAGAEAVEMDAAKLAKQQEREAAKVAKATQAAEKAKARLEKLQASAEKAAERAAAARAKAGGAPGQSTEQTDNVANL